MCLTYSQYHCHSFIIDTHIFNDELSSFYLCQWESEHEDLSKFLLLNLRWEQKFFAMADKPFKMKLHIDNTMIPILKTTLYVMSMKVEFPVFLKGKNPTLQNS